MTELERLTGKNTPPSDAVRFQNGRIMQLMSIFLNFMEKRISLNELTDISESCHLTRERAYAECVAALCDVGCDSSERAFTEHYFVPMIHELSVEDFQKDSYYQTIHIQNRTIGNWKLQTKKIAPCEAFVCDDFRVLENGRMIPQIGYFTEPYEFPAVLESDREWMTLMPNETVTTLPHIKASHGNVVTLGMGLGYYAFHASEMEQVSSVTIVEKSREAVELFSSVILPQFPCREKIRIICMDAFDFLEQRMPEESYDFLFADIWHDVGDGREMYSRIKQYEEKYPNTEFHYWLEDTIRCYLVPELWPPR